MAQSSRRNRKRGPGRPRGLASFGWGQPGRPTAEALEARRLLAIAINEFGGTSGVNTPTGIAAGPDGNLWFTEPIAEGGQIGRITPSGSIQTFGNGLSPVSMPEGIAAGPDDALWFTEPGLGQVGRIDTDGNITEFPVGSGLDPSQIALGADGALWFTETSADMIGRITTTGQVTQFPLPNSGSGPSGITPGPDGALWFTETATGVIGRITTTGQITEFALPDATSGPAGITSGPDGDLWFTETSAARVGRITPGGVVTEFAGGITAGSEPDGIAAGSDGRLWFTEHVGGKVGAVTTAGSVTEYATPEGTADGIATGADGNLWFTSAAGDHVDRISTGGSVAQFPSAQHLTSGAAPIAIAPGPDDALWFTEGDGGQIGRISTSGAITEFSSGITPFTTLSGITEGPAPLGGGMPALWFTETNRDQIGEITTAGVVTEFGGLASGSNPTGITLGPDGNLWFTEPSPAEGLAAIGRITPGGGVTEFPLNLGSGYTPENITAGPDGALWFTTTTPTGGSVGRITTTGQLSFFPIPNDSLGDTSDPGGIVTGPDGALWFADAGNHAIGRITATGMIQEFTQGLSSSDIPASIALGADGNLWFSDPSDALPDPIGTITPQGAITLIPTPTFPANPYGITAGPDGNIWFVENFADQIGQAVLPQSIANAQGTPASVVATLRSSFEVATFSDLSSATNAANFTATIDYGDGTPPTPGVVLPMPFAPGSFEVIGSHAYGSVGPFTAHVTIGTAAGNLAPLSAAITASDPIKLTGGMTAGIAGRRTNTLAADVKDMDVSTTAADLVATITWADGTQSRGKVYQDGVVSGFASFSVYAGHVFAAAGTFINTVTIADIRSQITATGMLTADVAAAPAFSPFVEVGPPSLSPGAQPTAITPGPDGALWFVETNGSSIGRIDTGGAVVEFPLAPGASPQGITTGPDGALWFTESATDAIGRITTTGAITEFSSGITPGSHPGSIALGPDGNLWFTEAGNGIGRITPQGIVTEFTAGLPVGYGPESITSGPDGDLWFLGAGSTEIGQITPQGVVSLHPTDMNGFGRQITEGPDGALWFTEPTTDRIGRIDPTTFLVTQYTDPAAGGPAFITSGPDGSLYFTVANGPAVGRITTSGAFTTFADGLTANQGLGGIATGPDGNVYFAETNGDRIGQLVLPQASVTALVAPLVAPVATKPFSGVVATFTENSSLPTPANFVAVIDWGDGTPNDVVPVVESAGSFSISGTHTYANFGPYAGSITVINEAGSHSVAFLADVAPVLVATGVPITVPVDRTFTLPVATFTDADAPRPPGSYNVVIQWGDGTTSPGTVATSPQGQLEVIGTHEYTTQVDREINVIIGVPSDLTVVGSAMSLATVLAPVLSVQVNTLHATAGNPVAGTVATVTDGEDQGQVSTSLIQVTIDWGDGTPPTAGTLVGNDFTASDPATASHVYAKVGAYVVTIHALKTDTLDEATGTGSALVEVAGPIDEVGDGITGNPGSITSGPDGNLWFTEALPVPAIGRVTTGGVVTEFTAGLPAGSEPIAITPGPDGNLWFTQDNPTAIGRVTPQGVVTEFTAGLDQGFATDGITLGPDGALWFTQPSNGKDLPTGLIGRITPQGVVTEFPNALTSGTSPGAIALGPDGNLWFTEQSNAGTASPATGIGRITPQGVATLFPVLDITTNFNAITSGPDGALWFTESGPAGLNVPPAIGRITTSGAVTAFAAGLAPDSVPEGITPGPDGSLWFVDSGTNHVDRITTAGFITPFAIPSGDSEPTGIVTGADLNLWFTEPARQQVGQLVTPEGVVGVGLTPVGVAGDPIINGPFAAFADRSSLVDLPRFFTSAIAFGDGAFATGTLVGDGNGIDSLVASHTYAAPGIYDGFANLTDAVGTSAPALFDATISSAVPPPPPPPPPSFVVTNTADSGLGSLRQAILDADEAGGHAITFAIPSAGVATIVLESPLPAITGPSAVDGDSEAAFEGVNPGQPLIEVDGQALPVGLPIPGLVFAGDSGGSMLVGVAVFGFGGPQLLVDAPGVVVEGDVLGLRADGSPPPIVGTPGPTADGADVTAPGVTIGGPSFGQGNLISGNAGRGVLIGGPSAVDDAVMGNLIGVDATGRSAMGNGLDGVEVFDGAGHATIGPGNVISGNSVDGIGLLGSSFDLIEGNDVGTNAAGSLAVGNGGDGIDVDQLSTSILIGGVAPLEGNVVSGNRSVGVAVLGGSSGVAIEGDLIGTDLVGASPIGNGIAGVLVSDSPDNLVGPGNVVSGNGVLAFGAGIWIDGPGSTGDVVFGNKVGTDALGDAALGNSEIGVLIDQASGDFIGDGASGAGNLISGNTSVGVMIAGPGASSNLVAGNLIGTDAAGEKAIPNGSSTQGAGVYLDNAAGNVIGGGGPGFANLISGNAFDGAQVYGPSSVGNLFRGNAVGIDLSGTRRLGNGEDGLLINGAPGTRVVDNYFAANALDGLTVSGPGVTSTLLQGNVIGQGVGGQSLGNGTYGVLAINGAPAPSLAGNVVVNNTDGPSRDTSPTVAAPSTTTTAKQSAPAKKAVKVSHGKAKPTGPAAVHPKAKAKPAHPKAKPHAKK